MHVIKIGRNPGNDIIFQDQTVSGTHADIYVYDNGAIQIVDHSSNGTYVDQTYIHGATMDLTGNEILTFPGQNCVSVAQVLAHFGLQQPAPQPYYQPAPQPVTPQPASQPANVNVNVQVGGRNSYADPANAPKYLNKWCWGGFAFGWLWGVFNRVYWPLIVFIPLVGQLAALIICFILGANGNRYAWDKFDESPERFDLKQKRWNIAAFIVLGITVLGSIITIIVIAATGAALLSGF